MLFCTRLALAALALSAITIQAQVKKVATEPANLTPISVRTVGRTLPSADGAYTFQWPGVYFLASFRGPALFFHAGPGKQHLRVTADGKAFDLTTDVIPATYRITAPGRGTHTVRIDTLNENQDSPRSLGAFAVPADAKPARRHAAASAAPAPPPNPRQIEFIGDSHTVGYGNTSPTTTCTQDEVWSTTDTTHSPGALVAAHFHADYQLNAISGRGIVRNYNGIANPTVPEAYPFTLLPQSVATATQSKLSSRLEALEVSTTPSSRLEAASSLLSSRPEAAPGSPSSLLARGGAGRSGEIPAFASDVARYNDPTWNPAVIVISLGTNDFSTELHANEPWHTRDELHTAFENTYVAFVRSLRAAHPNALIVLWATDMAHGEIATEARRVADTLRSPSNSNPAADSISAREPSAAERSGYSGDPRIAFVEVPHLAFTACHGHPSTADDQTIADAIIRTIDANKRAW